MNLNSPSIARPSFRQKEKDSRRKRILSAAESVFASDGFHDASLTTISRKAGLAVGTLYLYFEDKADLYGNVLLEKMHLIVHRFETALTSDPSPTVCLRSAVHSQFSFHDSNRRFFEIFLHQHQVQTSPLHERHWDELEALKKRNLTLIEDCIQRGQAAGELKAGDARLYAVAFLGVTLQIIRQWIREKGTDRLADSADFAANCFLLGASQK